MRATCLCALLELTKGTDEEFDGFEYANAFDFWYGASFGHPAQAAMGLGWVRQQTDKDLLYF